MIELSTINKEKYQALCALEVTEEQKAQGVIFENRDSIK